MKDIRPKRRKSNDNPYSLESDISNNKYMVEFNDVNGKKHSIYISKEVYAALNQFELDDLKILNEYDRHTEHIEQTEESMYKKAINHSKSVESIIIDKYTKKVLHSHISKLSDVQKRRLIMYFFDDMTLEEIGNKEKCSKVAVKKSIDSALKKLKNEIYL